MEIFVFTIMPFKEPFNALYEDIVSMACSDRCLIPKRADQILDPGDITQMVLDSIQDAFFIIAEVSEDNPNVFYELGYAHALNKRIVSLANKERKLPFDIQGRRTVFYDTSRSGWENTLRNNLGEVIDHLLGTSGDFSVREPEPGSSLAGHRHSVRGWLKTLPGGRHLWMFAKREDLDVWSPQNDGEIRVNRDGTWSATVYLGWEKEDGAVNRWFGIKFGTLDAVDSAELVERCIRNRLESRFPPLPQLPPSFEELVEIRFKRVAW